MNRQQTKMRAFLFFALFLALIFCTAFALSGCSDDSSNPSHITGDEVEDGDGGQSDLEIKLADLTESVQFFGINVDGTYMEVMAFISGSSYRTAFNTCQSCYGSRNAYYVQSGNYLVCQNCGSRFSLSKVGVTAPSNACNPYPITGTNRTVTEDSIVITYEYLSKCKNLFRTWKVT